MNIICKIAGKVRKVGNNQVGIVLKKEIVDATSFTEKDDIEITVLEDKSILIQKKKR